MTQDSGVDHDDDIDDFAAEMEAQGADPDAVARFLDESSSDADDADDVVLWPENAEAFAVFTHCKWDRAALSTMESARVIYEGISGAEISSVCALLAVPMERRAGVLGLVRVMEAAALPLLNAE